MFRRSHRSHTTRPAVAAAAEAAPRQRRGSSALSALAIVAVALSAACGSEAGETETKPTIKRAIQRSIDQADWDLVVQDSADLAGLVAKASGTFQAAGVVEGGDGRRLHWAEYADGTEANRDKVVALFLRCDGDSVCVAGQAAYTATGAAITDAAGQPVDSLDLGEVVLHKTLKNHNLQKSETVLRLDLKRSHIVDPALADFHAGKVPDGKRRLVLLSAYGAAVGLPLTKLRAAVDAAGLFDEVRVIEFARRRDLVGLLPAMSAQDVLVWVGAGVLEPFSDKASKSVGMTLSRGVFGDELIHREHLAKLLDAPPLGGPGLIVLAGSNSLTADHEGQTGLMAEYLHLAPHRPVVGFSGKLTPATAEAGVIALLESLFKGDKLTAAMTAAAEASQASLTTLLTPSQADSWALPKGKTSIWGDTPPKSASLKLFLKNSPKCVTLPAGGECSEQGFKQGTAVPPEQLTAAHVLFDCEPTFDGPWLTCAAKNAATGADFSVRGVLTGTEEGDTVLVYATGAPSKKMKGVVAIGAGTIQKSSDAGGTLTISFGGPAAASTWRDGQDHCCVAVTPLLTGNQSQLSVLTVKR